jgi:NADPH:quinone reductase-like Zn-dependent oxidoreductase
VLVKAVVSAVNPVDAFVRSGARRIRLSSPFVIGRGLVGTVATAAPGCGAGAAVSRWGP